MSLSLRPYLSSSNRTSLGAISSDDVSLLATICVSRYLREDDCDDPAMIVMRNSTVLLVKVAGSLLPVKSVLLST